MHSHRGVVDERAQVAAGHQLHHQVQLHHAGVRQREVRRAQHARHVGSRAPLTTLACMMRHESLLPQLRHGGGELLRATRRVVRVHPRKRERERERERERPHTQGKARERKREREREGPHTQCKARERKRERERERGTPHTQDKAREREAPHSG